jgi:hypothetical protein
MERVTSASLRGPDLFCKAKVKKLDSLFGEEDVAGLEVAMDNSLGVRRIQSIKDLRGVV